MQDLMELFNNSNLLFISTVGLIALLFGSFLNVIIARLPALLEIEWRRQCEDF